MGAVSTSIICKSLVEGEYAVTTQFGTCTKVDWEESLTLCSLSFPVSLAVSTNIDQMNCISQKQSRVREPADYAKINI
jgi:hypothetical protein